MMERIYRKEEIEELASGKGGYGRKNEGRDGKMERINKENKD